MKTFRRMSVREWIRVLGGALDNAYQNPKMKAKLKDLNSQANSIRSWDLGKPATTKPTDFNGFRLL